VLDAWWHDAWGGDLAVLDTLTTPDVYHHWATGADSSGQAPQRERIAEWTSRLPDVRYSYEDVVLDGEYVAAVWRASDGAITWGGMNIFRLECGRIAEVWSEMDVLGFRAQLSREAAATPAP
jgi:predicted ester cyclase